MEVTQYTEAVAAFTCIALMAGMMVTFTLGRRAGIRHHQVDPAGARTISGAVEASIFGLLGLLIAFTFDGASDRFEARRTLITEEANAIDTAWTRLDLLAAADRATLRDDFRDYLDARLGSTPNCPTKRRPRRKPNAREQTRSCDLDARGRRGIARDHWAAPRRYCCRRSAGCSTSRRRARWRCRRIRRSPSMAC